MSDDSKKPVKLLRWIPFVIAIGIGVAFSIGSSTAIQATNTVEFCTSCHSMQWVKEEWMESFQLAR